jgi:hypothetical protein
LIQNPIEDVGKKPVKKGSDKRKRDCPKKVLNRKTWHNSAHNIDHKSHDDEGKKAKR